MLPEVLFVMLVVLMGPVPRNCQRGAAVARRVYTGNGTSEFQVIRSRVGMDRNVLEPARFVPRIYASRRLPVYEYLRGKLNARAVEGSQASFGDSVRLRYGRRPIWHEDIHRKRNDSPRHTAVSGELYKDRRSKRSWSSSLAAILY